MKRSRFAIREQDTLRDAQILWFPSRPAFLRYYRSKRLDGKPLSGRNAAAACLIFHEDNVQKGNPFAELLFYQGMFSVENIAHEVSHALLEYFQILDVDPRGHGLDAQEEFALLHGKLTGRIIRWRNEEVYPPSEDKRTTQCGALSTTTH